jgi:hypothetical protein
METLNQTDVDSQAAGALDRSEACDIIDITRWGN